MFPRVAGHSATQAALLSAEVGFNALFFGRIDYQDLDARHKNSSCEFIWRASPSLGSDAQVFSGLTGSYGGNYGPPDGFDWNVGSNDEPVEDDSRLDTYNVQSRVNDFVNQVQNQASMTRGSNIMLTLGSDFNYESANNWFVNIDKIIKLANADGRVNAFYSSPEIYAQAKFAEAKSGQVQWPLVEGNNADFFPYADGPHQFWTGYFTSRPAAKRYVREQSAFHNAVRQMQSLAGKDVAGVDALLRFEEALGVHQHHDAISGTAKQHVAFDYAKRVARGQTDGEALMAQTLNLLTRSGPLTWSTCRRLNETVCPATQAVASSGASGVTMAVWNQLGQARTELITVPVAATHVVVTDAATGQQVTVQVMAADETLNNYARNTREANYTASFLAEIPAVGFSTYRIAATAEAAKYVERVTSPMGDVVLENEHLVLTFSGTTGHLSSMKNKASGMAMAIDQYFCTYESNEGDKVCIV
jgi:alpha-mannosidase